MIKMTGNMMDLRWAFYIALFCSTIVQGNVEIEPRETTAVRLGESLKILCKIKPALKVCRVEIPGEDQAYVLSEKDRPENGIEYYGAGTAMGECGVHIMQVRESHNGIFKCELTAENSRKGEHATLRIIVAKPPNKPELHTSPGLYSRNIYRKGEKLEISCSATSGRPAANISLFLDDEPIGNEERPTIYDSNIDDKSVAVQNATRLLDWTDNGRMLRCVASHIALDQPKETSMPLQVYYPPQVQGPIERFGYVIGRQGIVNVTVYANPKPHFVWRIDNEKINEGRPDESNRIETSTAVDLGRGAWSVVLRIDSIQKSDTEKEYVLEARNDEGSAEYRIILSTSAEPAGFELDAGSIIGIIVGVLVLLLVVFIVIFARATGRLCFAASRRSDEETTGGIGAGSEAHITHGEEEDEDHEDVPRIIDEKIPPMQGGQENPIHASTEYINGRAADVKDIQKDDKTDTPV